MKFMKIEVNKRGKKEYYDEFLYVVTMRKRIKKNPNQKVQTLTFYLKKYICYILLSVLLFIFFYYKTKNIFFMIYIGMVIIILLYIVVYLLNTNKMIKTLMSKTDTKIVEINKSGVEYKDSEKNIKIDWKNIEFILLNKYSICFIPKDDSNIFISISSDYKYKVLTAIKEFNKEDLIKDNSQLYEK